MSHFSQMAIRRRRRLPNPVTFPTQERMLSITHQGLLLQAVEGNRLKIQYRYIELRLELRMLTIVTSHL